MDNKQLKEQIIEQLGLIPLTKEGGMVLSTYRSEEMYEDRNVGSAIYYLLTGEAYSHLHMLSADEMWHHYLGDSVEMIAIDDKTGELKKSILGKDILNGERPQVLAAKNTWQGARMQPGDYGFALMGTTMSPGFKENDFILGTREAMLEKFPQHEADIANFTGELIYN
ncbi:cupin domain-containing protein [Lactovum odontotermitis]